MDLARSDRLTPSPPSPVSENPDRRGGRAAGVGLMLGSAMSNQVGAAVGASAFPVIGPVAVVAVRQWVAAVVLLAVGRPRWRAFTAPQWRLVLALAAVFATMNLALYTAIDRIGLGLAVTLEFLGPLGVALAGALAATRNVAVGRRQRRVPLSCAAAAAVGVVVLSRPQPTTDHVGIGLALLAALCWAAYILLNRALGQSLPGVGGSAAAGAVSALLYVPVGVATLLAHRPTPTALACAAATGVLSSGVTLLADLLALRRVPAHLFGIFAGINPVFAALVGAVVLGQSLSALDLLAIGLIVGANTVGLLAAPPHGLPDSTAG